jgi:hypothetical protein
MIVRRKAIPQEVVNSALRRIYFELIDHPPPTEELLKWRLEKRWFPWLEKCPEIQCLVEFTNTGLSCASVSDTQIILHFPDRNTRQERPHLDKAQPGERLSKVVGIALTRSNRESGGLRIWEDIGLSTERWEPVDLDSGDVVIMDGNTWHSGGPNLSGHVRVMVYFRFST